MTEQAKTPPTPPPTPAQVRAAVHVLLRAWAPERAEPWARPGITDVIGVLHSLANELELGARWIRCTITATAGAPPRDGEDGWGDPGWTIDRARQALAASLLLMLDYAGEGERAEAQRAPGRDGGH